MRLAVLCVIALLLTVEPVQAQERELPAPTPTPIAEITADQLEDIVETAERGANVLINASQQLGANTVLIFLVLGLFALFIVLVLAPQARNSAKSSQTLSDSNKEAAEARREVAQTNRELIAYLRTNDQVIDRNTAAYENLTGSQKETTNAIKENTETLSKLNDSSVNILKRLDARDKRDDERHAMNQQQNRVLNDRLDKISLQLDALLMDNPSQAQRIKAIQADVKQAKADTGPLDEKAVPDDDPAAKPDNS